MPHPGLTPQPITRAALELSPRALWLALAGLVLLAMASAVPHRIAALSLILTGLVFVALTLLVMGYVYLQRRAEAQVTATLAALFDNDAAPSILTDSDGRILYANRAARTRHPPEGEATLVAMIGDVFAAPASVLYALQNRTLAQGAACEEVSLQRGALRVSVHRVGQARFLWRLDDLARRGSTIGAGAGIALPMMTVSQSGAILSMNEALRQMLGGGEDALDAVIADLPLRHGEVHQIVGAHGPLAAQVFDMAAPNGKREIYLLPEPPQPKIASGGWGLVDSLPVPLLRLDRSGRVLMANRRARGLLGVGDATGRHFADLVEGLGRPVSDWLREAWGGRNLSRTETMRATHAQERYLQISLERYEDQTGPALVAVLNDATELKSLETQFLQSQKMEAIGQLAGGVAHDFNNLLTAISGHCDLLLLRHSDAADPDFADLNQVSQNANRAASLVGQLLAFSRKQTLRPEVFDLADTMGDLAHLLGRLVGEKVHIELQLGSGLLPVRADKRQLEQVLMNLVVNARDAMLPGGGTIRLALENSFLDRPLERDSATVPPGDYVTVRVIDDGCGIAAEQLTKIFEPFFTTKRAGKGTGLGLSMVYGIVKQSGGFIFVDSSPGSGTAFTLFLPVFRGDLADSDMSFAPRPAQGGVPQGELLAEASSETAPAPVDSSPAGGVVLLVEDEAPVRAFASRALKLRGFTVLEAGTAEEALAILEDGGLDVDIFVTDVVMPGMDGPTWVAQALRTRPGVRVVFVSGYAEDSVSEHQLRIPNAVFLPKPFSLAGLTATVARQLQ